jgi:hypothetical protein
MLGNLSIGEAIGDQRQHLRFAGGQTVGQLVGCGRGTRTIGRERRDDGLLDAQIERRVAGDDRQIASLNPASNSRGRRRAVPRAHSHRRRTPASAITRVPGLSCRSLRVDSLRAIASLFPVEHLATSMHSATVYGSFSSAVSPSDLLVLAAWAFGAVLFAAQRFSWLPSAATA